MYDYKKEKKELLSRSFEDYLSAIIALAEFREMANAMGYRGKASNLSVIGHRIVEDN